jgi:hypothetical protein
MIEVHVSTGWRSFKTAKAWIVEKDGTLRVAEFSAKPEDAFKRWLGVFAPGGWQGLATDGADERPELGFRRRPDPPVSGDQAGGDGSA